MEYPKLEEPSTGIVVGHDVKYYPKVPADWYRNTEEQMHVADEDWKYVDVKMRSGKVRHMRMGSTLEGQGD